MASSDLLALSVVSAAVLAPLLSMVTTSGRRDDEWLFERSVTQLLRLVWRSVGSRWSGLQYPPRGRDISTDL